MSPGPALRGGIVLGLVAGSVHGFAEALLAYLTGSLYHADALIVFAPGFLLFTAMGLIAGVLASFLRGLPPRFALALLAAPILLSGVRGPEAGVVGGRVAPAAALALFACLLMTLGKPTPGRLLGRFLGLSATLQPIALLMATPQASGTFSFSPESLLPWWLGYAALAWLLAAMLGSLPRPLPAALGWALVSLGLTLAVAESYGVSRSQVLIDAADGRATASMAGPNILIVTLDTVRQDHISAYGYARRTTPHLDALAGSAMLFDNAYANSPYTLASHASMFTGLLPSEHGAHAVPFDQVASADADDPTADADYPLRDDVATLAQNLRARGYATEAISANFSYLAPWTGLARGFDRYDCPDPGRVYGYVPLFLPVALRIDPVRYARLQPGYRRRADEITDVALERVAALGERPFLLFLNYMDAHAPYANPPPYDARFTAPGSPPATSPRCRRPPQKLAERGCALDQYDGAIAFMDEQLARLFRALHARGLLDGMLVIVTSDHGELFGEHGLAEHDNGLYEPLLRVPLVVKLPGQRSAVRLREPITLREMPTVIERVLAGTRDPHETVRGLAFVNPTIVGEHWFRRWQHAADPVHSDAAALRAVFAGPLKAIQKSNGKSQVYDLAADPKEERDLASVDPGRAATLGERLRELRPIGDVAARRRPELKPEVIRRLRALGYIQ